ncbi:MULTISPECIES: D-isomer specific 2-hydroxyacid dehydrogenase family protein [Curtobacterium]|jgi:phosphoglycerate dehydrogenase-like enzyme|uniref:D-isomer specific 2-hydroxyacid dehydrogenase family protein n=1 Tax=Curtobacterium poinsettiae TaxID=159612 RepID=A0ABT3RYN6_9MICO|nr:MULTISPECIES: D-isomer specific 2-hydroxyacid dehydrogenase family protein [Curtobacterium]EYT62078.1 2-hydroxyacid dehydrogenase [Curtobacterium flaccumfaciens UCD-AKU]MBT1598398.1 D-isomer specific 2-hydroxyacid dehydrogenase family protein [Curtobacterium flaccumfaciens pv. flaccumfaciens]MBT1611115.1 D-isomer specific 2-hydroxyacid dehydrogenase family protein [Curtobacterium flaccumfaciens pv. poinsettiae]MCS6565125.1 D-isomer specific 2-hydroxyacid dehydrogenase family protein [Curtoba
MSTPTQGPRGHRAVVPTSGAPLPVEAPQAGPVAVLPEPTDLHVDAVTAAGGTVAPLDADTRGIVWLDPHDPSGLADALSSVPGVGWVQLPFAGVDAFAHLIQEHGDRVLFTSAKGAYAEPVAEHALALTLGTLRVLQQRARASSWATEPEGVSLYGRNVVVIGAGGIALEYLRLLAPFDVEATVVRRSPDPVPGAARTVTTDELDQVLPDADVVMIAAAMTSGTAKLFGERQFRLMKPSARLVNIARGGLVDTDALVAALRAGEIAAAGLDVTDPEPLPDGHPLWSEPGAVITPHQADTPEMVAPLLAERVRLNTTAFLGGAGEGFVGVVDPVAGY